MVAVGDRGGAVGGPIALHFRVDGPQNKPLADTRLIHCDGASGPSTPLFSCQLPPPPNTQQAAHTHLNTDTVARRLPGSSVTKPSSCSCSALLTAGMTPCRADQSAWLMLTPFLVGPSSPLPRSCTVTRHSGTTSAACRRRLVHASYVGPRQRHPCSRVLAQRQCTIT
jgi:hypothetical protein